MQITKQTPAQIAAFTFRLTGGKPNPDATSKSFRTGAETMAGYAIKAAASKTGKYRGYTEAEALELAADQMARSITVPAELRKLMGA